MIIRSHEGPDARDKRSELGGMEKGYTIDHVVTSGQLITIFSAPDYPQFQVPTAPHFLFTISFLEDPLSMITLILERCCLWNLKFHALFDANNQEIVPTCYRLGQTHNFNQHIHAIY